MPKGTIESARTCMVRRRQHAREVGLCVVCCKRKPASRRTTCIPCNTSALVRQSRKREKNRKARELQQVTLAHEHAGDVARDHHLHEDAVQYYQRALNIEALNPSIQLRISEKLAHAFSLGDNPRAATPWYKKVLIGYLARSVDAAKTIELLDRMVRQSWLDANMEEAVSLRKRAIEIAEASGNDELQKMTNIQMAATLTVLDRPEEASRFLSAVQDADGIGAIGLRALYYSTQAGCSSMFGKASAAYESFERANQLVGELNDLYQVTAMWNNYANRAVLLGNIGIAKNCLEKALIVARRNNFGWRIPYFCLAYADLLFRMGRYDSAHEYLIEALSYDADVPVLEQLFVVVGIPISLHLHDEKALAGCINPAVLEMAFRSGQPSYIGLVATAFVQLDAARGHHRKAQALLHRVLANVNIHSVAQSLDLPIAVAQFGVFADIWQFRTVLEARTKLPSAAVAQAHLTIFDACIERRNGRLTKSYRLAAEAAKCFDSLQWYRYVDIARSMIPMTNPIPRPTSSSDKTLADLTPTLTDREQQIAELVIKGSTNRQIAAELSISKHTVESHMRSVMSRLGIRSRHQLGSVLPDAAV